MAKDDDLPAVKPEEKPMATPDMAKLPSLRDRVEEPALKAYVVRPVNMQEPPFFFSNTPGVMLINAYSVDDARHRAFDEAGHIEWQDDEKVKVEEFAPRAAGVLARDLRI